MKRAIPIYGSPEDLEGRAAAVVRGALKRGEPVPTAGDLAGLLEAVVRCSPAVALRAALRALEAHRPPFRVEGGRAGGAVVAGPPVVLGLDVAWGGLGWAVATPAGPRAAGGGWDLGKRVDRFGALVEVLAEAFTRAEEIAGDGRIWVAIEEPPPVFNGIDPRTGKPRQNQAATSGGLGQAVGAAHMYARVRLPTQRWARGDLPLSKRETAWCARRVPPSEWRASWSPLVHGPGQAWKDSARKAVVALGWGVHLPAAARKQEDTAEAILLAVAVARTIRGPR